ncbi:MAG: hypothetical protein AAGK71_10960 [Pseudomonadota bacterium]
MSHAQLMSVAPQFASHDFDRTAVFYAQFGYREVFRLERYMALRRDGVELHFNKWDSPVDPTRNFNSAYVRVLNVTGMAKEWDVLDLPDAGCPRYGRPGRQPHGMIEAHTVDPDGNLLIYGSADEGGFWDKREE